MPRKAPAEPIDHHYNIPKLSIVFLASGAVLTLFFVWMVYADYDRDWKSFQRTFLRLDRDKTLEMEQAAREKAYGADRDRLRLQLASGREQIAEHGRALARWNRHLTSLNPKIYGADQTAKFLKASFDAALYKYEDDLARHPKSAPGARTDVEKLRKELADANLKLAELKRDESQTNAQIQAITSRRDVTQASIDKLSADYKLARQKAESLHQDTLFEIRNSPIFDMINPSLRVQQIQLPEHFNDVNFMKIPRVDRCTTCHMAAERKGFEKASVDELVARYPHALKAVAADEPVYLTHPRLNLMVGSESPHPIGNFGCTPCHGGRDRASSFWSAGHSPEDERQAHRWTRKYDWQFDKFDDMPILPIKYAEAGCYRCHADEANFREAPTLDAGMKLVEGLGCWGCHRIEGLEKQNLPKVGPSLEKVSSKVTQEWARRWVMNPASFRANTRMPNFFYQENFINVSGERKPTRAQLAMNSRGRQENDVMVNSIVAYLFDKSKTVPIAPASPGDAARGQKLIADRGCFGCHMIDPRPDAPRDLIGTYRQFGPNLAGIGSKASRDWIFQWISDPKKWNPETKMPNLRLTPQDAADISEYLSTLKAPAGFEQTALPQTDPKVLDDIAFYFETATKTRFDARADLNRMDLHAKEVYTGEKLIGFYGCYACHKISGFEDAKPIGTELTEEGSKAVHRLDFGFVHLEHTRQDWFRAKLANPRLFDRDKARGWEEKLKMPNFRFKDWELDKAVTAVLGFQKLNASPEARKELTGEETAIERGRRIVKDHNCQGCHIIEGFGGSFRSLVPDPSLAPPIIQGEGAKVQSDWLFSFLKAPKTGQIRPWLEVHMPTFGFSDAELDDLTRYFAYLDRAQYPFLTEDYATDPRRWEAGRKVFEVLRCKQCHPRSIEDMNRPGVDRASLAPNLQMASTRLRHDWINDWIRRPDEWMPGTRMPTNFPKGDNGERTSPIGSMVDAPSFASDRADFAKILGGDDAARAFLNSPDAVTRALRDYVWSIGINGGTAPAGNPAPQGKSVQASIAPSSPRSGGGAGGSR